MTDDRRDEDLEPRLRSSFERARISAAPASLRAHFDALRREPQTRPRARARVGRGVALLAAAALILAGVAGTSLLVGSPRPSITPGPAASPSTTASGPAYVPPGPMSLFSPGQVTSGTHWRLLGGAARLPGPAFEQPTIELYTDGGVAKALDLLGLANDGSIVDSTHDAVIVAAIITGDRQDNPYCGEISLRDVTVDSANGVVTVRYGEPDQLPGQTPPACAAVAVPAHFAIALSIAQLPQHISLQLQRLVGTVATTEATATVALPAALPSDATRSLVDELGSFAKGGIWARTGRTLWTSTDGARTWQQIALPANPIALFVADDSTAWTVSAGPGSVWPDRGQGALDPLHLVVSRTVDRGKSWQASAIDGNFGGTVPVLGFVDMRDGYLLAAGLRFGPASSLLHTADGGATWSRVAIESRLDALLGSRFVVGPNGWLWAGSQGDAGPVGRPLLDVSRDGGRTWADAGLPGLEGDITPNDRLLAPPAFFGADGVVAVAKGADDSVHVYGTTDNGPSWQEVSSLQGGSAFVAAGPTTWYLGGGLRRTIDAGATWQSLPASDVSQGLAQGLAFSDPNAGAAAIAFGDGSPPAALFVTRDGGTTWQSADFGAGG